MPSFRFLPSVLLLALLSVALGCGKPETPQPSDPVASNTNPPPPDPAPTNPLPKPPGDPLPPIFVPVLPQVDDKPPPMPKPDPLPPDEPVVPGPKIVVPPQPTPNPVPPVGVPGPPPVGTPDPVPPQPPADPAKKHEYPKMIAGRDLNEWIKEALTHKDPQYRESAIRVLPLFGPDARKPIIGPLCEIMASPEIDPCVRVAAINIVANLGFDFRINDSTATPEEKKKMTELRQESRKVINSLMQLMANTASGSFLRMYSVQALATFGPDAHRAVGNIVNPSPGSLRTMAHDASWATRQAVAATLGSVGVPPEKDGKPDWSLGPFEPATDILLNILLKDKCAAVRVTAIQSLLQLGPPKVKTGEDYAKAAEKYLKPVAARCDPPVVDGKVVPNGKIAEEDHDVLVWLWLLQLSYDDRKLGENLKKICQAVKEPRERDPKGSGVRLQALYAITALGPRATAAVPTLRDALEQYDDPAVVAATLTAIAAIGPKHGGADALPELTKVANGSRDPKKPDNAPKDWKPDPTLRLLAEDAIKVVKGEKKLIDLKEEADKEKKEEGKK